MSATTQRAIPRYKPIVSTMKALVFRGPNKIGIEQVPIPRPGPGEAVIRVTLTTICGTDLHILRGEYPVKLGLTIGHEPVGVIHELGLGVTGYQVDDRVLVGAITPCGQCAFCLNGKWSQCGGPIGGWKFGNTINGAQAEYLLVPHAQANMAKIPDDLRDEQVVLLADIASTGISAAESAEVKIGDTVAVFAQGPIGLCATAGAKLKGASFIIARGIRSRAHCNGQADGGRRGARSHEDRRRRGNQATHRGRGSRCSYRGSGNAGDVRRCASQSSRGRHAIELGSLFRKTLCAPRTIRSRPWGPKDRYNALPWR